MRKYYIEDIDENPAIEFCEECPEGYILISDELILTNLHTDRYRVMREDGILFCNSFCAKLYIMVINGEVTQEQVYEFEAHMHELKTNIVSGDWMTGLNVLEAIPLSGIYTQDIKDEIQSEIENYISNNY